MYAGLRNLCPRLSPNNLYRGFTTLSRSLSSTSPTLLSSQNQRSAQTKSSLPANADIVICGGGVIGCSIAYHLAKLGWKDIVLLEQGSLACGTTWHAVGLIGKLRRSNAETQLCNYGAHLYQTLEQETGLSTGYKTCGGLYLARTQDRMTKFKRNLQMARQFGINAELVSPQQIEELCPVELRMDDLQGGLWIPDEGLANPSDITQSLARGATMNGVKMFEKVALTSVVTDAGVVRGVTTDQGDIACRIFVNCAGQWARDIGQMSNPKVNVPLHSCEHFYIVTKDIKGVHSLMPTVRDRDGLFFFREWSGGIMAGGFESRAKPCFHHGIPDKFEFQLLPEDWDHFGVLMDEMLHRLPGLHDAEVRQLVNGPESFTPDGRYIVGEAPEVRNYYVAAGMCSSGITSAAGLGKVLSEWITEGRPTVDLWTVDIKRFASHENNKRFLHDRVKETVGWHYTLRAPYDEPSLARQVKCSPLYTSLTLAGAVWGEKRSWERANYFASEERGVADHGAFGKPAFLDNVQSEVLACFESAGVVDMTSNGIFEISSPDRCSVEQLLQRLCCNDVNIPVGHVIQTAMLNEQGCYETVCSLTRTSSNSYIIQVPTTHATVTKVWIQRHARHDSSINLRYLDEVCQLGLFGPKSEELLQSLTLTSLQESDFPMDTFKEIDVGYASYVKVLRKSGNSDAGHGWQLVVLNQLVVGLYNQLMDVGQPLGIKNVGYYAIDSMDVMRGYPRLGVELGPFVNPYQAGLDGRIDIDKDDDFIGKKALQELQNQPINKRLVKFLMDNCDDDCIPWGTEPILRDGQTVGVTSSTTISQSQNGAVCMGYVKNKSGDVTSEFIQDGDFEINIAGELHPAKAVLLSVDGDTKQQFAKNA